MNPGIILQISNCILGHLFDHIPIFREPPYVKLRNYEHYLSIQVLASDEEGISPSWNSWYRLPVYPPVLNTTPGTLWWTSHFGGFCCVIFWFLREDWSAGMLRNVTSDLRNSDRSHLNTSEPGSNVLGNWARLDFSSSSPDLIHKLFTNSVLLTLLVNNYRMSGRWNLWICECVAFKHFVSWITLWDDEEGTINQNTESWIPKWGVREKFGFKILLGIILMRHLRASELASVMIPGHQSNWWHSKLRNELGRINEWDNLGGVGDERRCVMTSRSQVSDGQRCVDDNFLCSGTYPPSEGPCAGPSALARKTPYPAGSFRAGTLKVTARPSTSGCGQALSRVIQHVTLSGPPRNRRKHWMRAHSICFAIAHAHPWTIILHPCHITLNITFT